MALPAPATRHRVDSPPPRAASLELLPRRGRWTALLAGLCLALSLAGCTVTVPPSADHSTANPAPVPAPPTPAPTTPSTSPEPTPIDLAEPLEALEEQYGARVGLYAFDTASGAVAAHRADERFAFASTIKALAAAVVLDQTSTAELDEVLRFGADDLLANSPVTRRRLADGVTLREAIQAAVRQSDNTAGNLLFDRIGGPAGLQAALREAGDATTVVSRREPELNRFTPGDDRDTTTAEALATTVAWYTLEGGLAGEDRELLIEAMRGARTGDGTIRAGTPRDWTVANKTGTGSHGTRNDVAVIWPDDGSGPLVLAVMTRTLDPDGTRDDALLAKATDVALAALTVTG